MVHADITQLGRYLSLCWVEWGTWGWGRNTLQRWGQTLVLEIWAAGAHAQLAIEWLGTWLGYWLIQLKIQQHTIWSE